MICEDCGSKEGEVGICPYADDIYNEQVACILCKSCYHERCMDI